MNLCPFSARALCASTAMLFVPLTALAQSELETNGQAMNNTRFTAQAIAASSFITNSNANVFGARPTAIITGRSSANDVDFFSFTAPAGAAFFDIDGAVGVGGIGGFDSYLALFDANGTLLADNDDAFPADPGSATDRDAFIGSINLSGGLYFIAVGSAPNFANATFTGGDPVELTRPDGGFGGFAFDGATSGDASFAASGIQTDGLAYTLAITVVPAPSALAVCGLAGVAFRRRRR